MLNNIYALQQKNINEMIIKSKISRFARRLLRQGRLYRDIDSYKGIHDKNATINYNVITNKDFTENIFFKNSIVILV